jgi:plasmid stabilization system protein ParE
VNRSGVDVHPDAVLEAAEARLWYSTIEQSLGEAFADELDLAIERVAKAPNRWPLHLNGTRCVLLHRFPYLVVYRERSAAIQVVAVSHAKRKPGYWKER